MVLGGAICCSSQKWEDGLGPVSKGQLDHSLKFFCSRHTRDPPVYLVSDNKGARESLKFEDTLKP